jgi:hypothetical protein
VEGEQRVHGAVERRYRLRRELAVIDREAAASMSLEEHRHGSAVAMAAPARRIQRLPRPAPRRPDR